MRRQVRQQRRGVRGCCDDNENNNGGDEERNEHHHHHQQVDLLQVCRGKILSSCFFEASTRTACSFEAAMMRLGGTHLRFDGDPKTGNSSAAKKGESLQDTVACLECYTDVTVLRHPVQGSVEQVLNTAKNPVINAGDGVGEHPTQALLDVFTIYDELKLAENNNLKRNKPLSPLTVVMLGDLKHGRTVHSLAKLLAATGRGVVWDTQLTLRYCAPPGLEMPTYVERYVEERNNDDDDNDEDNNNRPTIRQERCDDLVSACAGADVLYVTRIQRERFESAQEYDRVKGTYVVDESLMRATEQWGTVVLHPLPRVDEIDTRVDSDPRAAYFRQMENGMYVRMALLSLILSSSSSSS